MLVADDDTSVHEALGIYFRREEYQVLSAYDGDEALEMVRRSRPDIVVLDVMMPKKD